MRNRFVDLFFREMQFGFRILVVLLLVFVSIVLFNKLKVQAKEVVTLEEAREMVARIPQMEKTFKTADVAPQTAEEKREEAIDIALTGIWIQNNIPSILIGDKFYNEGDSIGDYIISKVTSDSVTLQNKTTKEAKELYISK